MHKVIVERPRWGSRLKSRKTALRLPGARVAEAASAPEDFDGGSTRAPSSMHDKGLNENLAPLGRFIRSQVGRPWDKVFSEIRQAIDTRSAVGLHVMQHLPNFVSTDTFLSGRIVYCRTYGSVEPVHGLYVHPVTRLLRDSGRNRRRHAGAPVGEPNYVFVSPSLGYEKIEGLWYRVEFQLNDPCRRVTAPGGRVIPACWLPDFEWAISVIKKQCDKKTIRKIEQGEFGPIVRRTSSLWAQHDAAYRRC